MNTYFEKQTNILSGCDKMLKLPYILLLTDYFFILTNKIHFRFLRFYAREDIFKFH